VLAKKNGKVLVHRSCAALLVSVLVATVLGAGVPAQAAPAGARSAAVAAGACPFADTLCLFDQPGYSGARFTVSALPPGGVCVSLVDHGWGGRARSALNTNGTSAALFMNDDCVGGPFQVSGNSGVPDFGTFRPDSVWVP
jgi:hypothetical protein